MMIYLIKSNTDEQQCPLTLLTNMDNFGARKYHNNIEYEPVHFDWHGLTTVRWGVVGQVNTSSLWLARLPAARKWRSTWGTPDPGWGAFGRVNQRYA